MERFLTELVFCEAPLDGYGTSVFTTGAIKLLVSGGATKPAATKAAAQRQQGLSGKSAAQRLAGFAFDGLQFFDTVVMH